MCFQLLTLPGKLFGGQKDRHELVAALSDAFTAGVSVLLERNAIPPATLLLCVAHNASFDRAGQLE